MASVISKLLGKSLQRSDILAAQDIEIEQVDVPEWGGSVFVKGLTGAERDRFEGSLVIERGKSRTMNMANFRAKLACLTICDEKGSKLFTEKDVAAMTEKSASALQRIFVVSQKLSRIKEEDVAELTEELEADPFEGSPSD